MGYFSKRKRQKREKFLLSTILILLGFVTLAAFFDGESSSIIHYINIWRFQFYILLAVVFFYALFSSHLWFSGISLFLIIINYMLLASAGPLFTNREVKNGEQLRIFYQNDPKDMERFLRYAGNYNARIASINFHRETFVPDVADNKRYNFFHTHGDLLKTALFAEDVPLRSGKINFSHNQEASFVVFDINGQNFVLLNLYFAKLPLSEQSVVFKNLREFVLSQNEPVIIIGDFGLPAWTPVFKNFLEATSLEVKNKIILSEGKNRFNPLAVPSFYVLAYKNVGIDDITFFPPKNSKTFPLGVTLKILPNKN